jgi:hypothetical protein
MGETTFPDPPPLKAESLGGSKILLGPSIWALLDAVADTCASFSRYATKNLIH